MIITISGEIGSGKSTVARIVAEKLGLKHYSMGDMRRKMAIDRGMTLSEFNELGEREEWTDKEVDSYQAELAKREDNFVIDSRLGFFFIPESTKVFLKVDEEVGAKRLVGEERRGEKLTSISMALEINRQRKNSDIRRYKKYYNLNPYQEKHYDLIIDATKPSAEEVAEKIIELVKNN